MAVIKKPVIFSCDVCPRTFANGQFLYDVQLPVRVYDDDGTKYSSGVRKLSICNHCFEVFTEVLECNFAIVEVGLRGTKAFPVFEIDAQDLESIQFIGEEDKGGSNGA